jgi:hypothetical protein
MQEHAASIFRVGPLKHWYLSTKLQSVVPEDSSFHYHGHDNLQFHISILTNSILSHVRVTLDGVNGFIDHLYTPLKTTSNYSAITNHHSTH